MLQFAAVTAEFSRDFKDEEAFPELGGNRFPAKVEGFTILLTWLPI